MEHCKNIPIVFSISAFILFSTGCATLDKITDGLKLPEKSPGRSTHAQFPSNQAPHTLLKKPVASGTLTSKFGYRLNPTGILPKKHNGIDYRADTGTSVFSAGDGVIVEKRVSSSYGNVMTISHDNGFSTLYAHMDSFAKTLEEGSDVSKGQIIGTVGTTGKSTGPHLHYELRYRGKKINPLF